MEENTTKTDTATHVAAATDTAANSAAVPVELEKLKSYLKDNGARIASLVFLIVGIAVIAALYYRRTVYREENASRLLASAQSVQDLEALLQKSGTARSSAVALLRLAKVYYNQGNYDMAIRKYQDFEKQFPDHFMKETAELGRIHCEEARGQFEEARAAFAAFASNRAGHFLVPEAILGQGRCLEQLRKGDEARALYEKFIVENPSSGWIPRFEERLTAVRQRMKRGETADQPMVPLWTPGIQNTMPDMSWQAPVSTN